MLAWRALPWFLDWVEAKTAAVARKAARSRSIEGFEVVPIRMNALEAEAATHRSERNIFRYGQRPRPTPEVVVAKRPPPPMNLPPPLPPPPSEPQPPPLDVELVGIFGPERRRIAVLVDGEGEILNVLLDQVVREKFIVNEIGFQSVEFRFVGFPETRTARLEMGDG